jgi:hypothetical protein
MGVIARTNFSLGWMPDADSVGAPPTALLRMDNGILDELGIVSVRAGSAKINATPLADLDVHSLYTGTLDGVRQRFVGAGSALYINGAKQTTPLAGSGDVSFGATQGHVFWGRNTTKQSYDGTTVREWGLQMTGDAPTAQVASGGESFILATCASGESPAFSQDEGVLAYEVGQDGVASAALKLTANATSGRAQVSRRFTADVDTTQWSGGSEEAVEDTFECWVYVTDPAAVQDILILVDINRASAQPYTDYFYYRFISGPRGEVEVPSAYGKRQSKYKQMETDLEGYEGETLYQNAPPATPFAPPILIAGGWTKLSAKRREFSRFGSTAGTGWTTVAGIRVMASMAVGGTLSVIRVDDIRVVHGQLLGTYAYRYVLARETDSYVALSAPSAASADLVTAGSAAIVTIPPDADRTTNATAIWLYRMGGDLESFYRVATASMSDFTNVPFATTAAWEPAIVQQSLALEAGCVNYTLADELDLEPTFTYYGVSNHTSADESDVWVSDCGGSLTLVVTTGGLAVTDTLSDRDALVLNEPCQTDNTPPPDSIVDIAGPYYDRLFCLTTTMLHPSRVLNPESYSTGQGIAVGSSEETAYWIVQAIGGLYVGTSRDIYRLDGTLAELPDGTIEVQKVPLNIDHPPVGLPVVKDGPVVIYLAHDGWRAMSGSSSSLLVGPTSLLYRGQTRHGVEPPNLITGRVRATIAKGQLIAIVPEGTATTSSAVLYRYVFGLQRWYRHTYPQAWRSIAKEPDGTLIAGDAAGTVWTLDTGTTDHTTKIPIVLWTRSEDDGNAFAPKMAADLQLNMDSGGDTLTVAVHTDVSATASLTDTAVSTGRGTADVGLTSLDPWYQIQTRLSGSVSTFYFGGFALTYLASPLGVTEWDSGPLDLGSRDLVWIRHVTIKALAAAPLTVRCYFDGIAWPVVVATNTAPGWNTPAIHDAVLGRGAQGAYKGYVPRILITSTAPFSPYFVELIARSTSAQTDKKTFKFSARVGGETLA